MEHQTRIFRYYHSTISRRVIIAECTCTWSEQFDVDNDYRIDTLSEARREARWAIMDHMEQVAATAAHA